MASISTDKQGNRRILWVDGDGQRCQVRLGKVPLRAAENIKTRIEHIVAAKKAGIAWDGPTAQWVADLGDELADKLAAVGLIPPRERATLGKTLDSFLAAHPKAKPATRVVWGQVARCLRECFGEERPLRTIGRADAESFRQWLIDQSLSATTITKRLQFARQMLGYAIQREWIDRNPFDGVSHKGSDPRERQRYVTVEDTKKLIEAAPNWVWRTIIALARYGGLRTPSETLSLRLADLDWERRAMVVTSPKTEGRGQGYRVVPMFDRLRPYLEEAWQMAAEGQTHVIPENLYLPAAHGPRGWVNCNLRTTFEKIVRRAGLEAWPRLFHALRASCESDLARDYPITTVCKWIGNTVAIASRHYVQVTDEDFRRASGGGECRRIEPAQNAAQYVDELARDGQYKKQQSPVIPEEYEALHFCTSVQMEAAGHCCRILE